MKSARTHAAIADVSHADKLPVSHSSAQQDSGHHRNHVAEVRNWTNKTFLHVTEVNVEIFAAGWAPGFRHVLRKDFARADTFDQHGAEIPDQWREKVLRLQCVCGSHSRRFLAQGTKHSADDLCLQVEIHQTLFHETCELQVTIEFEMLLGLECGFSRTTQRLAFDNLTRRVPGANAHLKTRMWRTPAMTLI